MVVFISRVVSTVQRVGVPVTIQALDPPQSLPSTLAGVVHSAMFQDGFGGSAGLGWVRRGIKLRVIWDNFSISSWGIFGSRNAGRCQWSQWSGPFQL